MSCVLKNNNIYSIKEGILMIRKLIVFGLIAVFLLSGCEQLKELYGIETGVEEEYIPIEEIKIEEDLPPALPEDVIIEELEEEIEVIEEIIEEEEVTEEEEIGLIEEIIEEIIGEEEVEVIEEEDIVLEEDIVVEEEITEEVEETAEEAKVIIVEEKDLVSLKPKVTDPDEDSLSFTYTTPLDEVGKWQTTYGDAGEYTVTVTASDGELSATKDVLIIVNKKEETPVIDSSSPEETTLKAKEDSTLEFSVSASDLNNDVLEYSWKLDGEGVSTGKEYTYNIGYDGAGQHTVKITVSDSVKEASKIWSVEIDNVNREPVLEKIGQIKVKETETVVLEPKADDPDEDSLTFSASDDNFDEVDGKFEWETTYDDSGEYTVTVTASDGEDSVSQEVSIVVENVNRAPVIEDIILE